MVIFPGQTQLVIFDMDGLLIDSEPYWKIAEKEVFGKLGLNLTDDLLRQVMGFRLSEVVQHWYHYQPWPEPNFEQTERDVLDCVKQLIQQHADAMPGVYEVLTHCKQNNFKMALASSSAMELIEVVIDKLNIRHFFDMVWSAQYEKYGKPHPAIFLSVSRKLQVEPKHCVVFEDAINGVIAAKAARMYCIAIPEEVSYNDPRFAIADVKTQSLLNIF
ncbi:MAG: hexitol phosphatase HxpB [Bacteroidia bacterium]